jgi:hypothetical protein
MKKLLMVLLVVAILGGCSGISGRMANQVGKPISEIIDTWGPASQVTPDGRGGLVYTWMQWVPTGYGNGYWKSRSFYADQNGIIYRWHWKGL